MIKNPLLEKINDGRTSLGLFVESPDMVELCGHLGFDWFGIDQMFTGADWSRTENLIRAGEAAGITPVVRVQSNPWLGHDNRIAVDVTRAQGVGAQFILVSHSDQSEIESCLHVSKDWHRKLFTIHPFDSFEDWDRPREGTDMQTFIIPQPESRGAFDSLEDVIRLPGVKIVLIAMTDGSRVLTGSNRPDFYHPALWEVVDRAVALGKEHGVTIGANTSYAYDLPELERRIGVLQEHGVRMILVQGAMFLFQVAMTGFLQRVRKIIEP